MAKTCVLTWKSGSKKIKFVFFSHELPLENVWMRFFEVFEKVDFSSPGQSKVDFFKKLKKHFLEVNHG